MAPTLLISLGWLLWVGVAHLLTRNPRHEPMAGATILFMKWYSRLFHRLRVEGFENVPQTMHPGPLVLVSNHTAGLDPVLLQGTVPFEIRFMMARDMMPAALGWLWKFTGVIPVNRDKGDMTAVRQALRYLEHGDPERIPDEAALAAAAPGGVIGVFPEGGIERPARVILPFQQGVGLIIHKSGARVLQVVIDGAPQTPTAWGSLFERAKPGVRIRFLPIKDYRGTGMNAAAIAADLRQRLVEATGWPTTQERGPQTQD